MPNMESVKKWGKVLWNMKGTFNVVQIGRGLFLLEFDSVKKVERVLKEGRRVITGKYLQLEKWNQDVNCVENLKQVEKAWVRIVGLPVHLWSRKILKKIGDGCGSFMAVDEGTTFISDLF